MKQHLHHASAVAHQNSCALSDWAQLLAGHMKMYTILLTYRLSDTVHAAVRAPCPASLLLSHLNTTDQGDLVLPGAWKARSTSADHSPITLFIVDCSRQEGRKAGVD